MFTCFRLTLSRVCIKKKPWVTDLRHWTLCPPIMLWCWRDAEIALRLTTYPHSRASLNSTPQWRVDFNRRVSGDTRTTAIAFYNLGLASMVGSGVSGVQGKRGKQVTWWSGFFLVSEACSSLQCCFWVQLVCSRLSVHEAVFIDGVGVAQSLAKSHAKEMENKHQPWRLLLLPIRHTLHNAGLSLHLCQESHRKILARCNVSDFDFPVIFCSLHKD